MTSLVFSALLLLLLLLPYICVAQECIQDGTTCTSSTTTGSSNNSSNNDNNKNQEETKTTATTSSSSDAQALLQSRFAESNDVMEWILQEDYESLDETLPVSIKELKKRGAHRCWHKHSTFLQHLLGVHNVLRLWDQSKTTARVGLLHSAYSNSYVNLALFDPKHDRTVMKDMVGNETEALVYLFCIIHRQNVVVESLLGSGRIPPDGLTVPHLRNPESTVYLSPEICRLLLVFTMADIADQYFGWIDDLFDDSKTEYSMLIPGKDDPDHYRAKTVWPGVSKPGLWMSYISELGAVAKTTTTTHNDDKDEPGLLNIKLPPVFDNCTKVLTRTDEMASRDAYWEVVTREDELTTTQAIDLLKKSHAHNPFAFEPLVVLAQLYSLEEETLPLAEATAIRALDLQSQWGTAWDKRLSFAAWIAWTRVILQRAETKQVWPSNSWNVINFGMVY